MNRPWRTGLWLLTTASLAALGLALVKGHLAERFDNWTHPVVFLVLGCALDTAVIPLAAGLSVSAGFPIILAGLLLLGPPVGAFLALCATLFGEVCRKGLRQPEFALWRAGVRIIATLAAGLVFRAFGGQVGHLRLPDHLLAVLSAAIIFFLFESAWAAALIVWETRTSFLVVLKRGAREVLGAEASLVGVGLLFAMVYQSREELIGERSNWGSIAFVSGVVLIPSLLLYYAGQLQRELKHVYEQTLLTLGRLVEARVRVRSGASPVGVSEGRAERLGLLAADLARELGLDHQEGEYVRYAAYLRDLGKIGVPGGLLRQPPLPFEADPPELRRHPLLAEQILSPISFLSPVATIIGQHHERFDGLGSPRGLRGDQICLGARILAVALAYDSLAGSGDGRTAFSPAQAVAKLQAAAATKYDPSVVSALARIMLGQPRHAQEKLGRPLRSRAS